MLPKIVSSASMIARSLFIVILWIGTSLARLEKTLQNLWFNDQIKTFMYPCLPKEEIISNFKTVWQEFSNFLCSERC